MLSDRELLILKLLEKGKTHKQISSLLGISVGRIAHLSTDAKRKRLLPPQSYERLLSNRTAEFLRNTCGPEEIPPLQIRNWLLDGTLRLYGHSFLTFKGIKTRNAGRATFLELCHYAGVDAAELRRLKRSKVFPPTESMINKSIAILERAGYKMTQPRGGISDHKAHKAGQSHRIEKGQYIIYSIKEGELAARPVPQRLSTMDEAAGACISLRKHGHKILRVRLPSGNYITGAQIEWAIKIGVSSVKIALTR